MNQERFEELMVRVVDGVATPSEREELMNHVVSHSELQQELEAHMALKAVTDGWVERLEVDLVEDRQRAHPLSILERGIGWSLFLVGLALLMGFGMTELLLDAEVPIWVKIGTGALAAGCGVLFASVLRWRWSTSKSDKYKEVIR
ncbi:MAG: hypothetical protein HN348_07365 [Proteobacteria bacterium]|jgi:hypothetical protein|nr:hypothetical protein [Pseudomonadota bacterium]